MRRKLAIVLLAVLVLIIRLVACPAINDTPTNTQQYGQDNDTPTDTPQYNQGQAIAVVESVLMPLAKADILRKAPKLSKPEIADYLSEVTAELASYMANGTWTSEYVGEGRWLVRCIFAYGSTLPGLSWVEGAYAEKEWYVYEQEDGNNLVQEL